VKDMLLHYRRTVILNELLDKESAVQAIVWAENGMKTTVYQHTPHCSTLTLPLATLHPNRRVLSAAYGLKWTCCRSKLWHESLLCRLKLAHCKNELIWGPLHCGLKPSCCRSELRQSALYCGLRRACCRSEHTEIPCTATTNWIALRMSWDAVSFCLRSACCRSELRRSPLYCGLKLVLVGVRWDGVHCTAASNGPA
jgi:hypothetical protein